jgi:GWxTD domain-containing protein
MFRVLTPRPSRRLQHLPDSASFAALSPAERERWRQLFWAVADPRPSTRLNEALLEFQARLAYADLRWTNEIGQRGVETDKGDVHVRYGPPDVIYGVNRMNVWTYRNGDVFFFTPVANHFGRRLAQFEEFAVDSIKRERPVAWDNMPLVRRTWPMRVRVARFRATADSMDAIVAAAVPVRSFLGDAELQGRFPIDVTLDVADAAARVSGVEKRQVQVAKDSLPVAINGWWTRRVGAGLNVVRVDAQQADVERFALGTADAVVDSTTGFGMSDVLLGLAPRVPDGKAPERWTDVTMTPTVGVFPHRSPLGLVWETYDLAPQNDNVTYTVTLELERTFQRNLAGFVARIAGNLQNLVTRDGSGTGKISVTFQQTRRAAPVVTDYLSVDLDGSVTGPYRLRLTVRDNVTGRTVTRTADFHLTQD